MNVYGIALGLLGTDGLESVRYYTDENGNPTETRIDFTDGTIIIAADEHGDQGNINGFTYTCYDSQAHHDNGEETETDGSDDIADLASVIMHTASEALLP